MARPHRKSEPTLRDELFTSPYLFEFHQAIKLLELTYPEAAPLGEGADPVREVISLSSRIYFESLSSDIYSLTAGEGTPPRMEVNFMGLAGIHGPLPYAYAEIIYQRVRAGDSSLRDFLDIFNHRLISILHQTRKQYMMALNTVTPEKTSQAQALRSFIGIEGKNLKGRLNIPDRALLPFGALLWQRPRSRRGLEQILRVYYKISVEIEENVGCWRPIQKEDCTRLGVLNSHLGQSALLGTRVWDQGGRFCVHIGPLTENELDAFLPEGDAFSGLVDLIKFYADPHLDFEINYRVREDSIPTMTLNRLGRLGWRTWLHRPTSGSIQKGYDHQVRILVP